MKIFQSQQILSDVQEIENTNALQSKIANAMFTNVCQEKLTSILDKYSLTKS